MNISLSSALRFAAAASVAAIITGCEPDDGRAELDAGRAAYEAQEIKKAVKLFEKSLKLAPDRIDALVCLARAQLDLGELEEARKAVAAAEALAGPGDTDVKTLAAQIAWHLKDYAKAAKLFGEVAAAKDASASLQSQAMTGLGIVHLTCDERDLARIYFLRAIRLDRRNAAAWYHLGLLYRDAFGYLDAALEQFNVYVRLDVAASPRVQKVLRTIIPGLSDSIRRAEADRPGASRRNSAACAAALSKAEEAEKKGNWKTAAAKYKEAHELDALSVNAALGLARAIEKTDTSNAGRTRAFECYRTVCQLSPGKTAVFLKAGKLAYDLGRYGEAAEIYSRAVAATPSNIDAIDGLIRSLQKTGGSQKIAAAYQKYRESIKPIKKK